MAKTMFACTSPGCNHKMSRNQLYGSNGRCIYCKVELNHKSWMTNRHGSIQLLLGMDPDDDKDLKRVCQEAGIEVKDAINAAMAIKLKEWLSNPEEIENRVKQDLMLAKLYRR